MKIAIYDDEKRQLDRWMERLQVLEDVDIWPMNDEDFRREVGHLEDRRRCARKGRGSTLEQIGVESELDSVDIFIVDYDLLGTSELTGEEIAYLARCFSSCGVVVALNQYGSQYNTSRFDLSLRGHPESFADLNLGDSSIDDPGIWSEDNWREFRPWSWPLLPDLVTNFRRRVADVEQWVDQPILKSLLLDEDVGIVLPSKILEFIQGRDEVESVTFRSFVVDSGNCLKRKDAGGTIDSLVAPIAAARLHRWLESFVLGGQEILVDTPHLVARYSSLLDGPVEKVESWDRTNRLSVASGIKLNTVGKEQYPHRHWLSRPAWYWSRVRSNTDIEEVADPWSVQNHGWVFCEDTSAFSRREDTQEFRVDLPTKFDRRFANVVDGVEYYPSVRFSL